MASVRIHPDVVFALASHRPVVALESAVISSGLPREVRSDLHGLTIEGWRSDQPVNLELARAMERTVRANGALPATVAVIDGSLRIGAEPDEIATLAQADDAQKAAVTDLGWLLAAAEPGRTTASPIRYAGTTVSATLAACKLTIDQATRANGIGIRVLATGGIGGVHRNWHSRFDVSADLQQLAKTPVCVVCSGAKSILDVPATLETLEALGVPIIGFRTDHFPQFICGASESLPLRHQADDTRTVARICAHHWWTLESSSAVILANPAPAEFALDQAQFDHAMIAAEQAADHAGIAGPQRTPFLLDQLSLRTSGASLRANVALLINNARIAAELAHDLATLGRSILYDR